MRLMIVVNGHKNRPLNSFLLSIILLVWLFAGCAAPPRDELGDAQKVVARAYSLGADHLATRHYQAAYDALKRGEKHLQSEEYEKARAAFAVADHFARVAIKAAREEQDRLEKELKAREEAESRRRLEAQRVSPPPEPRTQPAPEPSKPESKPAAEDQVEPAPDLVHQYEVQGDENLWSIAARPEVYDDPLLWPILYRSNRDQIKDPRILYDGQTLDVPRDVADRDLDEARDQARQSEIFPVDQLLPLMP